MIVQGAHAIRRGEAPSFTPGEGCAATCSWSSAPTRAPRARRSSRSSAERLPDALRRRSGARHPGVRARVSGRARDRRAQRGAARALNPDGQPVRGGRLRIGDKLMMTGRNLHELGLMNGTLLRLLDEVSGEEDDAALILGAEEAIFRLPLEQADRLRLGVRVLGAPRAGDRAAGRGDRRAPGRRRVLPAPRDALHGDHPREARDRDRRDPRGDRARGAHARHRPPAQPAGRARGRAVGGSGGSPSRGHLYRAPACKR